MTIDVRDKRQFVSFMQAYSWEFWLKSKFSAYVPFSFAAHHIEFWDWLDAIEKGERPRPFVAPWGRGGAKSTSAELGVVRLWEKQTRKYIWYVSSTQDKADKHVESIASLLEYAGAKRAIGKYGASRGWRRERLRTSTGLTVDALGLDTGMRGAKVDDQRPDMIILDDVDENEDSKHVTLKKLGLIKKTILPAGSNDVAVLFIQNLISPNSIMSRLVDGRADFIADKIVSGPHPAIKNFEYEKVKDLDELKPHPELREYVAEHGENLTGRYVITGGEATWEGQSIPICQNQIVTWGLSAFLEEAQHDVAIGNDGKIFRNVELRAITDREIATFYPPLQGIDWGYFPHPLSFGKMYYNDGKRMLYIFDEYRSLRERNQDSYTNLVAKGKLDTKNLLVADSAEPGSIADYRKYGAKVRGSTKGAGSIRRGIKWLQSLDAIVIDPERCPHHAEEFVDYEHDRDIDGNYIDEFLDENDDAIDDTRYATNPLWIRAGK